MNRTGLIVIAGLAFAGMVLPRPALAQLGGARTDYMSSMFGYALSSNSHSTAKAQSPEDAIKEFKRKFADADPRVRVEGIEGLRDVDSPGINDMVEEGLSDPDVRVRIKAIDILGAREASDAVPLMTQELFLRETPAIEKLHLVAALGRIGDSRGALPVIAYLNDATDPQSRGTAAFALGEIGDPRANDPLIKLLSSDKSPMVRRLAQEALEKIDGEMPTNHGAELAAEHAKTLETTDQKLAKLRQIDEEIQKQNGY